MGPSGFNVRHEDNMHGAWLWPFRMDWMASQPGGLLAVSERLPECQGGRGMPLTLKTSSLRSAIAAQHDVGPRLRRVEQCSWSSGAVLHEARFTPRVIDSRPRERPADHLWP